MFGYKKIEPTIRLALWYNIEPTSILGSWSGRQKSSKQLTYDAVHVLRTSQLQAYVTADGHRVAGPRKINALYIESFVNKLKYITLPSALLHLWRIHLEVIQDIQYMGYV